MPTTMLESIHAYKHNTTLTGGVIVWGELFIGDLRPTSTAKVRSTTLSVFVVSMAEQIAAGREKRDTNIYEIDKRRNGVDGGHGERG